MRFTNYLSHLAMTLVAAALLDPNPRPLAATYALASCLMLAAIVKSVSFLLCGE